jgi:PPP family 3-phenylpropionic acid transporter
MTSQLVTNSSKGSLFFKISAFFFFYFVLVAIYIVFLPKILSELNYSTFQIGFIFSLGPLMRFFLPFFFLNKIKLTSNIFHFGLVLLLISSIFFYFTIQNFYYFIAPNILLGISFGLMLPFVETFALGFLKKEKFGKSRLYGSLGFMLCGIILARNLTSFTVGLNYFLITVILLVIVGLSITTHGSKTSILREKITEKFIFKKAIFFWISIFFMQMSFGFFYNFFTIYETSHGVSLKTVSYLWTFSIICEITLFYFQAALFKRIKLLSLIKLAIFLTIIRWFLLYLFPNSIGIAYLSQSLHAFGFALHHTAAISFLYLTYQDKKLASQFYYGLSFGLGGFFGALISGYLYGDKLFLYAAYIAILSLIFISFQKTTVLKQNF